MECGFNFKIAFLSKELDIVLAKNKSFNNKDGKELLSNMIKVADLTRKGFINGDISTVMVPEQFYIGLKILKFLKTKVILLKLHF